MPTTNNHYFSLGQQLVIKTLQLLKSRYENPKYTPVYTVECALNTACQEEIAIWNWFRNHSCNLYDQLPRNVYKSKFPTTNDV